MKCPICHCTADEIHTCVKCHKKVCPDCYDHDSGICHDCQDAEEFDPQGELDMMYPEGMDDGEYLGDD